MSTVKKNIIKNGIATALQKTVKVLEQLLLVPFFISAWGVDYYGEWLTLTIIPTMLAFSDLGFGSAAANSFVLKYLAGDKKKAADIFKTGFIIISVTIIFATLLSFIVLCILNYYNVFDKLLIDKSDAILSVSILIIARLILFYNQLFGAYFIAARKAAYSINLLTVNGFLNIFGGAVILILGYGVIAFAVSQLIVAIIFNLFYAIKARTTLGLHKDYIGTLKREYVNDITKTGLGYLMSPIWQAVYFQGTTFVVRIVIGPAGVVIFNTVRALSRTINQLFNMVSSTVFPEFQYEFGKGNIENAHKIFRMSMSIVLLVALIGASFLSLFGLWFYAIWTNNELEVPSFMWNIFVLGILFNAVWWTSEIVYRALNKPFYLAKTCIIAATISVIASYFLGKEMGLNGVAIGSLLLDIILAFLIFPNACKLIGIPLNKEFFFDCFNDFKHMSIKQVLSKKK